MNAITSPGTTKMPLNYVQPLFFWILFLKDLMNACLTTGYIVLPSVRTVQHMGKQPEANI